MPKVFVLPDHVASQIAAGEETTCALIPDGGLACWGANTGGLLDGTSAPQLWSPSDITGLAGSVVDMSTAGGGACAVLDGGALMCWGINAQGEVGDGTTVNRQHPVFVRAAP